MPFLEAESPCFVVTLAAVPAFSPCFTKIAAGTCQLVRAINDMSHCVYFLHLSFHPFSAAELFFSPLLPARFHL